MKVLFTYPVFLFVILFAVACGKQDSAPVGGVATGVVPTTSTVPNVPVGMDLRTYCYSMVGQMTAGDTICEINERAKVGARMSGTNKIADVYANEEIQVLTSMSPKPRILISDVYGASTEYPANAPFVAARTGVLMASGNSWDLYRIREVMIRRCVNTSFQIVACP